MTHSDDAIEQGSNKVEPLTKKPSVLVASLSGLWFGVGLTLIPSLVLLAGFVNTKPQLWRDLPQTRHFSVAAPANGIAWSDGDAANPPLEYLSESITFSRVTTEVPRLDTFWDLFVTPQSNFTWHWTYEVKNLTQVEKEVSVTYYLADENGVRLSDASVASRRVGPGATVMIEASAQAPYEVLSLVRGGDWEISHR